MASDDLAELHFVNGTGFNEVKHARFIFVASGLQRNGGEVLGGEDPRANAINISLYSLSQSFFEQRTLAWKKLNGPTGNQHVLALRRATFRLQVVVNRFGTDSEPQPESRCDRNGSLVFCESHLNGRPLGADVAPMAF